MRPSPTSRLPGDPDHAADHPPVFRHCDCVFSPDPADLLSRLGLECYPEEADDFLVLLDEACLIARPKAAYCRAVVTHADRDTGRVVLAGTTFTGRALAERAGSGETVWPHLATCGRELEAFVSSLENPLERFWGESILMEALLTACRTMEAAIAAECGTGRLAYLGPGSLPGWALEQQMPLFCLLGQAAHACGVSLTDTLTMLPAKSLSGLYFIMNTVRSPCGDCHGRACASGRPECLCRHGVGPGGRHGS